jgi:hypothetical protein
MMNNRTASREQILEPRVCHVKRAGRERFPRRLEAQEQTTNFQFLRDCKSPRLKMLDVEIGGAMCPSHRRIA